VPLPELAAVLVDLVDVSKAHPTVEIRCTILDGHITIGFPKGEQADAAVAAWGSREGHYLIKDPPSPAM